MGASSARDAAIELLTRQSRHRPANRSGLVDLDTVQFGVERHAGGRSVIGATFTVMTGAEGCLLFFAVQDADGSWRTRTARMVLDAPLMVFEFGASAGAIDFVARIHADAATAPASVRLTLRSGRIIDLPVEAGWAAIASDGDLSSPILVELVDGTGTMVWSTSHSTDPYPDTPPGQTR